MFYFDAQIRTSSGDDLHRCVTSVRETEDEVIIIDADLVRRRFKGQLVRCMETPVIQKPTVQQVLDQLAEMPLSNNLEILCSDGLVTVIDELIIINQPD